MPKKKKKQTYSKTLLFDIIVSIIGIIIVITVNKLYFEQQDILRGAKEEGVKTVAKIQDIDEVGNPMHDINKEDRHILSMTLKYTYKGEEYTTETSSSYKQARIGDKITIYIRNNNPKNIAVEQPYETSLMPYLISGLTVIIIIACGLSIVVTLNKYILYKRAEKSFVTITGKFSHVEGKKYMGQDRYYIICESDGIDGFTKMFKSHFYYEDPTDFIKKINRKTFKIKYNPNKPKEYIIDTDGFDNRFFA